MKRKITALAFVIAALSVTGLTACDEASDSQTPPPAQQGYLLAPSTDGPTALS